MFRITDDDSPVIVQLIGNGLVRNLALPANEERALVVGSTASADFHVSGLRVAPVQFHLERHERAVWLIPAYGVRHLRLNSAPVLGPAQLEEHNVIQFAGVHLEATIRDADAFAASGDSLFEETRSNREFRASHSHALPDEADTTPLAMPPLEPVQEDARVVDTVRLVPLRNAPRPQFVPPRPAPAKPSGARPPKVSVGAPPDYPRTASPPPLGRHPLSFPASTAELPQHHRTATKTTRGTGQASLLARLGLLAKTRPLLAACFVGFGAALITLLLLAATRIAAPRSASSTTPRAPSLVASLNSLRPATLAVDSARAPAPAPAQAPAQAPLQTHRDTDIANKP